MNACAQVLPDRSRVFHSPCNAGTLRNATNRTGGASQLRGFAMEAAETYEIARGVGH